MTREEFRAHIAGLPTWYEKARIISVGLDTLPVGVTVGRWRKIRPHGLDWELRFTTTRRRRDRTEYQAENHVTGSGWGMALELAFGAGDADERAEIIDAAWRGYNLAGAEIPAHVPPPTKPPAMIPAAIPEPEPRSAGDPARPARQLPEGPRKLMLPFGSSEHSAQFGLWLR